jgi:hypothetical protein
MGALTEIEIFDCMQTSLKLAVEQCEDLAKLPAKGPTYVKLRENLRLIEGCCKQASAWREDTRWLNFAFMMGEVHKKAGNWLRGTVQVDGIPVKLAPQHGAMLFLKLADNLRGIDKLAGEVKNKATGRRGMILPEMGPAPFRETRQHRVTLPRTPGGIIIPAGALVH